MNLDIESIKRKLLIKYPFFGNIVANSKIISDTSISTARTDGDDIYYNPSFVENLAQEKQIFLFAHEICHIAFDHILRSEGKDKKIWNIATDAVINAFLMKDGLPLIEGGVNIEEAINYDAEQLYNKLLEEKEKNNQNKENNHNSQNNSNISNGNNSNNDNQEESQNVGHDDHDIWEQVIERKKQQNNNQNNNDKENGKKESIFDKLFKRKEKTNDTNNEQNENDKKKKEEIDKITYLGEKKSFKQNKIEKKKQLEELRKSLAEQSYNAGRGTNRDIRDVGEIGIADPLIDWRRLLKEAVQYEFDWSYKKASIEDGVVTPYLEEIPYPETEIVLDTSGSIDQTLLRNFLRECKNILQTSKVKVGCFDDEFYGFTEIRNESDIDNMIFKGGGGTNFDVAVNAFSRRVENKIIFTDGCADMPDKVVDAIWIVFGGKKIFPKGGKVIYISDEQLENLCSYMINFPQMGRAR